jgi:DNA repair protein RecN (Recombination protein N)
LSIELSVRGVGGIKEADMTFGGGFIVITGESGSGKSSLVRAMEFIAGKRARSDIIHTGFDSAEVRLIADTERTFDLPEEYLPQENRLFVRRVFDKEGRGRCYIQNIQAPLGNLALAMENELVIQSQFAQLGLLDASKQLELVDARGGDELLTVKDELATTFRSTLDKEKRIVALKKRRAEIEQRFHNGMTLCSAIKSLNLQPEKDSETELEGEFKRLENEMNLRISTERLILSLKGYSGERGILDELEESCKAMSHIFKDSSDECRKLAEETLNSVQRLTSSLSAKLTALESTQSIEERKEKTERKLGALRKVKRMTGLFSDKELIDYTEEAEREIAWLKNSLFELNESVKESQALKRETSRLAAKLRTLREEAAKQLEDEVNHHLRDMAMDDIKFEVEIEGKDRVRATGADEARFMLRIPDNEPMPVGKTASGGELSRILIALQLVADDKQLPGTIVFDEVEAGLGGKTALLAGKKLCELSKRCRTILITHEATIAAMADMHFLVKREAGETVVREIDGVKREREIARMLSGDENSQEALDHARALLCGNTIP